MEQTSIHNSANIERFNGFAGLYDDARPRPPTVIVDILTQLAQIERPRLVVDLGSGTGLSTRLWEGRADETIGVEPNADMRRRAESQPHASNIRYHDSLSHQTGLPDACADIVTCSQSLHWMEPQPTFAEAARILRTDGVFAAYDCDWPPSVNMQAEIAYEEFIEQATRIGDARGFYQGVEKTDKDGHLARMRQSGTFRYTKEIVLHSQETGDAERFVGFALSQGSVAALFKHGLSPDEIGANEFRHRVASAIGSRVVPMWFCYRMRIGIK